MTFAPIDYYDGTWHKGDDRPMLEREHKAVASIRRHVAGRDGFALLDVGCGDGSFLRRLDQRIGVGGDLHGVDYSHHRLEQAVSLPYTFRQCNLAEGIPYERETFDVVYSGEVIEHLYNPDLMLEECRRVLRPGGILVISTPNLHAWYNRVFFTLGMNPIFYEISTKSSLIGAGPLRRVKKQEAPVGHIRLFGLRGLADLLDNERFEVVDVSGAVFDRLPGLVRRVDRAFNRIPAMASILLVTARKRGIGE